MKPLGEGLADHLLGTVTTLCRCWRLQRRDGVVMGFTDHDREISFAGTAYEAASGLLPGDMEQTLGFGADSAQVSGALVSRRISEADIRADRYDGARIEVWLVNWNDPSQRMMERVFTMGEIAREDGMFRAELRGASAALDQTRGRRFQRGCDADLGDARCGVNLTLPQWSASATVTRAHDLMVIAVSGLDPFDSGHFRGGRIVFSSGANAGLSLEIADHQREGASAVLTLWKPPVHPVQAGDAAIVRAGCDKRFATCRDRFANHGNFRGFPHMPGNDFALGNAASFNIFDGKALVP